MSTFEMRQLGGRRRILRLSDHAAPHGRPRQQAVVEIQRVLRETEVYYAGHDVPTRHVFGKRVEPFELNGRWSDGYGGNGFAKAKEREVSDFWKDEQPVQMLWEDLVNAEGLITDFTASWESRHECVWSMTIRIDREKVVGRALPRPPEPRQPKDFAAEIRSALKEDLVAMVTKPPTMKGSIIQHLDSLISAVNVGSAAVFEVTEQIDSFATAAIHQLRRLRGGLEAYRTSLIRLRSTYDFLTAQTALESQRIEDMQSLWDVQASFGVSVMQALRDIAAADREAAKAQRGKVRGFYTATAGDTWEGLSARFYGDTERAEEIRQLNGVAPGSPPESGTIYVIPR